MFYLNPLNKVYLVGKQCIEFSMTFKKRDILSPNYPFPSISEGWVLHTIKTCSLQKSGEVPGAFKNEKKNLPEVEDNVTLI